MFEKILVIDDEIMSQQHTKKILLSEGYRVDTQSGGFLGIIALKQEKADLVLLDINMPEQDGIETFKHIRAIEGLEDVPIVFLTASGNSGDVATAALLGAVDYIKKPFQPEELLKRVRRVLDKDKISKIESGKMDIRMVLWVIRFPWRLGLLQWRMLMMP